MFEENEAPSRNKTLGFAAITAAGLSLLCIVIGQGASQYAELVGGSAGPALVAANAKTPVFNAIDNSSTASIKGPKAVISPCER